MQELMLVRVLRFFLENPYEEIYLRQLSKKLKLSVFATKKYADLLVKENLVDDERKANLRYFRANINNLFYRHLKVAFSISGIIKSGLISFLEKNISNLSSIVLFGSTAKGEDDKKSDVDIVIIGKKKRLDINKFQEKIKKGITLHVFSWSEWNVNARNNKAFYYEVITYGIPLYGELPLVK